MQAVLPAQLASSGALPKMSWRTPLRQARKDFDAWAYHIDWPQNRPLSPLTGRVDFVVEDIKFAYNAWCLLRLAMFFGVHHPKVMSGLYNTTPSMDIALAGNRLFYMHSRVDAQLSPAKIRVALTPNHPRAFPIQSFSWEEHCTRYRREATGIELVLGMENGLSAHVVELCDHCVYIPQYGSVGSLSMLSALAIAAHTTARCLPHEERSAKCHRDAQQLPSQGRMPLTSGPEHGKNSPPHETDLLACSSTEIKQILHSRRQAYPLQLSIVIYNELGDRNIGAVMRNANVFNCEYVAVINRKRFNRRGALGTQKVLNVHFINSVHDKEMKALLSGYDVWLLYPYYPNLVLYGSEPHPSAASSSSSFLRHNDSTLRGWGSSAHILCDEHPLIAAHPHLRNDPVFLDSSESLFSAVREVKQRGKKGILLAVPEEGCSPHPSIAEMSHRVVFVSHPSSLPLQTQRGLNPALSTAIGLERLRCAIDALG